MIDEIMDIRYAIYYQVQNNFTRFFLNHSYLLHMSIVPTTLKGWEQTYSMDFVSCSNALEKLMMMVVDRIERLENVVQDKLDTLLNPLETLQPWNCPSVEREGQKIADTMNVRGEWDERFNGHFNVGCHIKYQRNIDILRRNGFSVTQAFSSPLPVDFYTITWKKS